MTKGVDLIGAALAAAFVVWLVWSLMSLQRKITRMKTRPAQAASDRSAEPPPDGLFQGTPEDAELPIRRDKLDGIDFAAAISEEPAKKG